MRIRLIVHRVGNHPPGELLAGAAALFDAHEECEWREFNWSRIPGVVDSRTLSFDNIRRMTEGLASAARLGTARNPIALAAELCFGIAMTLPVLSPILTGMLLLIQRNGFGSAFTIQRLAIEILLGCAAAAAMVYLFRALTIVLVTRDVAPLSEFVRWAVLVIVRPIMLVCLLPFAPFLWSFLSCGGQAHKGLAWLTVTGLFVAAFGWLWGEPFAFTGNLIGAAIIIAGLCLTWFAGQLIYFLFAPTLKALLDVFRYLGDPKNRVNLQEAFDQLIDDLPTSATNSRHVTIYAHSLGSMIALDSLLHSSAWKLFDSVELVTFGSPLRRFVMRFFPAVFLPHSVQQLDTEISQRVNKFYWINFFRPLDYIGGRLIPLPPVAQNMVTGLAGRYRT